MTPASLFWIVVGIVLIIYVGGPMVIRVKQVMSADPVCEPANMTELPVDVVSYFTDTTEELRKAGFVPAGIYWVKGVVPSVEPVVGLYVNPTVGDKATVTVIFAGTRKTFRCAARHLEFITRLDDGGSVSTNNCPSLSFFVHSPNRHVFKFPNAEDARMLYRIHTALTERSFGGMKRVLPMDGHELADFHASIGEELDSQLAPGMLVRESATGSYRPTWKGAFLMTWGLLWPAGGIRKARMYSRARALLRELGIQ